MNRLAEAARAAASTNPTDEPAPAQPRNIYELVDDTDALDGFIARLPATVDGDQFRRCLTAGINATPGISQCEPRSVLAAALECTQLGLMPGPLDHVAFRIQTGADGIRQAAFLLRAGGIIDLAQRNPLIDGVDLETVWTGDHFEARYGTEGYLVHQPDWDADPDQPRAIRGFYVIVHYASGWRWVRQYTRPMIRDLEAAAAGERDPEFWTEHLVADQAAALGLDEGALNPRFEGTVHSAILRSGIVRRRLLLTPDAAQAVARHGQVLDPDLILDPDQVRPADGGDGDA